MKANAIFFLLLFTGLHSHARHDLPAGKKATPETINLYYNLKKNLPKGIPFCHQDDYAYDVNWKYEAGRSGIKDVTGDYSRRIGLRISLLPFLSG